MTESSRAERGIAEVAEMPAALKPVGTALREVTHSLGFRPSNSRESKQLGSLPAHRPADVVDEVETKMLVERSWAPGQVLAWRITSASTRTTWESHRHRRAVPSRSAGRPPPRARRRSRCAGRPRGARGRARPTHPDLDAGHRHPAEDGGVRKEIAAASRRPGKVVFDSISRWR